MGEVVMSSGDIVKKHNEIIKSKGKLSLSSQKILATIISMVRTNDEDFHKYAINKEEFLSKIGESKNGDGVFKNTAKELMSNPFIIDGAMYNWCSKVDLKSQKGHILFEFHPDLKPYLLQLSGNFTQYKLENILKFKSEYSLRLYELLLMEYKKSTSKIPSYTHIYEVGIEEFMDILSIPKSYKYGNIKQQVLIPCQNIVQKYADVCFTFEEKKERRKTKSIIFKIQMKSQEDDAPLFSLRNFIKYIRENFINQDLFEVKGVQCISVAPDGKLYDKYGKEEYNSTRSQQIWEKLYELTKENKLPHLLLASKFEKEIETI